MSRSDLTGMFDWARYKGGGCHLDRRERVSRSDLTGIVVWARYKGGECHLDRRERVSRWPAAGSASLALVCPAASWRSYERTTKGQGRDKG